MFTKNRNIKTQLTRFITGDCTPDERRVISGLIESDKEYSRIYSELSQVWGFTTQQAASAAFNVDHAWSKVEARLDRQPLKVVHKSQYASPAIRKYAAAALKVAAVLLIAIAIFQLVPKNHQLSFTSGTTQTAPLNLADGSRIFLNTSSTVKYPEKFGSDQREIYFWGEAFFEIAHDASRPFIIESGETRVKVLGTSFNVKAYPESDKIEVVVNSGKVLFYHVDKSDHILGEVTLEKGEKGVYFRKTGQIARLANDEPNYLSWKTGVLVFNETTLDHVLAAVGEKYGVTFNLEDKDLCKLKLTATFDNESLDAVLEVLKLVHNLQFVNNGKDYLVVKIAG